MFSNYKYILISLFACLLLFPSNVLGQNLNYDVSFRGITDKGLLSDVEALSETYNLKNRPPASLNMLKKRAQGDLDKILRLLRSRGLFKAETDIEINDLESPVKVIFHIHPGPFFIVRSVEFLLAGTGTDVILPEPEKTGFSINSPFESGKILEGERLLTAFIQRQGFPFVKIDEREIKVDHSDDSVRITFVINTGPGAIFGRTSITGLIDVDETFIRQNISYKRGDKYDPELISSTHSALAGLGLFATVRVTEGDELEEENSLPVNIEVNERKHRSIGAGLRYQTDEGPGIKASWEHRNLFHKGERFEVLTEFSNFTLSGESRFRKPSFIRNDQTLRLGLRLASDEPDAYSSRNLMVSGLVDREIRKGLSIGAGITFKYADITQMSVKESFNMISVPFNLEWDRRNDLLDPSQGGRLSLQIGPFYELSGESLLFLKGLVTYSHYIGILREPRTILAGRVSLGTIRGAYRHEIPADERFYAGGGGSIRGYAFQSAGNYSSSIPVGGKSLMELSVELRIRLTQKWGLTCFLDGGRAFSNDLFTSGEDILWATGLGVRYYTPIGPVRLDIAVPLKKREGIDDSFQVYINLGQSF